MHTPRDTIEQARVKISMRTPKRQVSWGDMNDEVVDH